MSTAYKTTKAELVAIYRLEFYRQKKNWKLCQEVPKGKDSKEKQTNVTKPAKKKSAAETEKPGKKVLNETYVVDKPASGLDEAFLESDSDKNLAKDPTAETKEEVTPQTKDSSLGSPKGWTNSSRNIALTSILQSEASREPDLPPIPDCDTEVQDVTDGPTWPGPRDEPRKWTGDVKDMQPMKVWSEELEWQESGKQQVFQPELWSPTRESPLGFTRDKVWSKEDQIWPQSPESWPEPVLWRGNALVWPAATATTAATTAAAAAAQQAKACDDTELAWSRSAAAATRQQPKAEGETVLLWAALTKQNQKAGPTMPGWLDDSQQVTAGPGCGLAQWLPAPAPAPAPDSQAAGERERWEALREWIEEVPDEPAGAAGAAGAALSPEVLVRRAAQWLHEPLGAPAADDWLDNCLSSSAFEFMRGAHCREHSSEIDLNCTRNLEQPQPQPQPPAALSQAALCACVRRHAGALHALLCEASARQQLSAELDELAHRPHPPHPPHRPHDSSSYEEFPTRDVGLQGPRAAPIPDHYPPNQGPHPPYQVPKNDNFISGSYLNDPRFDLESGSILSPRLGSDGSGTQGRGRGRGRLVKDDRVIGIGPGGRPYRL